MPLALIFVLPLVQMVLTSFMSSAEINQFPPKLIPTSLHIEGYQHLFSETKALRWLLNSVIVSTIAVVSHLALCSMAGYGFARLKFAGRGLAFVLILATVMIPIQLLMIPTYLMFARLGFVDTLAAAFVPWLASAFGIFLMRQFFLSLPAELEEAAAIDGATTRQIFRYVTLPLLGPTIRISIFLSIIGAIQLFDLVWVMTGGGPVDASNTMAVYMINHGFKRFEFGYASAVAVIMLMISLIIALAYQRFVLRRDIQGALTTMGR
jgi:multiple sugar transport system permease protein